MGTHERRMMGQSQMLEYVLLMVFVVAVIFSIMIFLTWWQITQLSVEKTNQQQERVLSFIKSFIESPYMTKENSIFDDGKLTALAMIPDSCEKLRGVYGDDWHAEIMLMDGKPLRECGQMTYPDGSQSCNYWSICPKQTAKGKITQIVPVNVYRRIGYVLNVTNHVLPRTYLGTLNVTMYV